MHIFVLFYVLALYLLCFIFSLLSFFLTYLLTYSLTHLLILSFYYIFSSLNFYFTSPRNISLPFLFTHLFISIFLWFFSLKYSVFSVNNLPRVHVYAFSTAEVPILDIVERYEKLSLFYVYKKCLSTEVLVSDCVKKYINNMKCSCR